MKRLAATSRGRCQPWSMVPSIFAVDTADKRAASAKQSRQRQMAKRKDALIGGRGAPAEAR